MTTVPYEPSCTEVIVGGGGAPGGDGADRVSRFERVTALLQVLHVAPVDVVRVVELLRGACSASINCFSRVSLFVLNLTVTTSSVALAGQPSDCSWSLTKSLRARRSGALL